MPNEAEVAADVDDSRSDASSFIPATWFDFLDLQMGLHGHLDWRERLGYSYTEIPNHVVSGDPDKLPTFSDFEETIASIDLEIARLQQGRRWIAEMYHYKQAARRRQLWRPLPPIFGLPDDVIGCIFELANDHPQSIRLQGETAPNPQIDRYALGKGPSFVVRIGHVCRRWRTVSQERASLWTDLRFTNLEAGLWPADIMLTRSKNAELRLECSNITCRGQGWRTLETILNIALPRIVSLTLSGCNAWHAYFCSRSHGPAPILKNVSITAIGDCALCGLARRGKDRAKLFMHASQLYQLQFSGNRIPLDWIVRGSLKRLELNIYVHRHRLEQRAQLAAFIHLLRCQPQLEYLCVSASEWRGASPSDDSIPIEMLALQTLVLVGPKETLQWMHILSMPSLTFLHLEVTRNTTLQPLLPLPLPNVRTMYLRASLDDFSAFFEAAPRVSTLSIQFTDRFDMVITLSRLSQLQHDRPRLLPNLTHVEIDPGYPVAGEDLAIVVASLKTMVLARMDMPQPLHIINVLRAKNRRDRSFWWFRQQGIVMNPVTQVYPLDVLKFMQDR